MVETRRIAASNDDEVGQMRSRRGTSMNRMTNELALQLEEEEEKKLAGHRKQQATSRDYPYRQMALITMIRTRMVNRLAMPRAKHRIMDRMPSLERKRDVSFCGYSSSAGRQREKLCGPLL